MLTEETKAVFARDLVACNSMPERGFTLEQKRISVASNEERHAAYEVRFDRMIAEVSAMEANSRKYVCDLLKRLGDTGCLSGSYEYGSTCRVLTRMGVTEANNVFEHDLRWIAETHMPVRETTL